MSTLLKIKGIKASKHKSEKFAILLLYFPEKNNARQLVHTSLTCEIYLIKGLKRNLFISNNIMSPKSFVIDVKEKNALIQTCGVTVPINTKQRE